MPAPLAAEAVRLAREKGVRAAARALGIDRNTVRKYLRGLAGGAARANEQRRDPAMAAAGCPPG